MPSSPVLLSVGAKSRIGISPIFQKQFQMLWIKGLRSPKLDQYPENIKFFPAPRSFHVCSACSAATRLQVLICLICVRSLISFFLGHQLYVE